MICEYKTDLYSRHRDSIINGGNPSYLTGININTGVYVLDLYQLGTAHLDIPASPPIGFQTTRKCVPYLGDQ